MDKINRDITLTTGFKLRLEESCPVQVLEKLDELVEGYNGTKHRIDEIIAMRIQEAKE